MSKPKEKFWVVNKYVNRITHRTLSSFEVRNPTMFELSHSAHTTWADAHQALMKHRIKALENSVRDVSSAERQFAKALAMKEPKS